jgi:hypothetical protein
MKHGYIHQTDRRYNLFVPHVRINSSSPKITETASYRTAEAARVDEVKARAVLAQLHITFG